jgi:hypothetical protein
VPARKHIGRRQHTGRVVLERGSHNASVRSTKPAPPVRG